MHICSVGIDALHYTVKVHCIAGYTQMFGWILNKLSR